MASAFGTTHPSAVEDFNLSQWHGMGRKILLHSVHAVLANDYTEPFRTFVQIKKKKHSPLISDILCLHPYSLSPL